MKEKRGIIFAGGIIGLLSVLLVYFGNPKNMGACIACFLRDTAGAVGLHRAGVVQYIRPEVIGIILGAFIIALFTKEFKVKGGSSPFLRFILGAIVMIGALMFLGCPLRMVLRMAGGDLNAVIGLLGFAAGIFIGIQFLNRGFSLKRNYTQTKIEGYAMPVIAVMLLGLLISAPAFILFSEKGPGSMHSPIWMALAAGLIIGIVAQKTRLCMVGGIRDVIMFKDTYLMWGFIAIFVVTLIGNVILGSEFFKLGFEGQPIAHNDAMWNFMGMVVAGWGSVLLGGCPLRQLVLAGEGNADSSITIMGMVIGAAFAHNFGLASSGEGPTGNGKIAVVIGIAILLGISYLCINKSFSMGKNKTESKGGVSIG
ncbi:YedE family putative selenium transporter [Clostridium sp.]|uniref:YedE family putative selenium transporter n=1 Tax=Clostridium sp. TaxID=1506 RepID=UPI003216C2E7